MVKRGCRGVSLMVLGFVIFGTPLEGGAACNGPLSPLTRILRRRLPLVLCVGCDFVYHPPGSAHPSHRCTVESGAIVSSWRCEPTAGR
nr:hypothetical protein [Thecaphora frezii]